MTLLIRTDQWFVSLEEPQTLTPTCDESLEDALTTVISAAQEHDTDEDARAEVLAGLYRRFDEVSTHDVLDLKATLAGETGISDNPQQTAFFVERALEMYSTQFGVATTTSLKV